MYRLFQGYKTKGREKTSFNTLKIVKLSNKQSLLEHLLKDVNRVIFVI